MGILYSGVKSLSLVQFFVNYLRMLLPPKFSGIQPHAVLVFRHELYGLQFLRTFYALRFLPCLFGNINYCSSVRTVSMGES